jgi:hypothetical protein
VGFWDDQQMTRVHWVYVAEGKQPIVLVDDAGIRGAGNDAAEDTIHTSSFAHQRHQAPPTGSRQGHEAADKEDWFAVRTRGCG